MLNDKFGRGGFFSHCQAVTASCSSRTYAVKVGCQSSVGSGRVSLYLLSGDQTEQPVPLREILNLVRLMELPSSVSCSGRNCLLYL